MLSEVGVLILIDEYESEELFVVATYVGVVAKQLIGEVENIVEVHSISQATASGVDAIDLCSMRSVGFTIGFSV